MAKNDKGCRRTTIARDTPTPARYKSASKPSLTKSTLRNQKYGVGGFAVVTGVKCSHGGSGTTP